MSRTSMFVGIAGLIISIAAGAATIYFGIQEKPPTPSIDADPNAQVQTGDGIQIKTGDNSPVSVGTTND